MASPAPAKSPVLITGGSGYIGSALVNALSGTGAEIRILSRHAPAPREGVRHFEGDITSTRLLQEAARGAGVVFHLAGQTSIPTAEASPERDREINVGGMQRLIEVVSELCPRAPIVHAGTITQVGLPTVETIDEATPDAPATVYDRHKLESEALLAGASRAGHVVGVTLRLANVYGPGPRSGSPDRGILNQFVRRALAGQPLTIYGHGNYLRDYVFIDDVVAAFLAAAEHATALSAQHFVIGTGAKRTFADAVRTVAESVERRVGRPVPVMTVDEPAGMSAIDRRSYVVDAARFRAATGWSPKVSFGAGIERTIDESL